MPAVVGKQRETVADRGAAYEDIQVADESAGGAQTPSFLGKYTADFIIKLYDLHCKQKVSQ